MNILFLIINQCDLISQIRLYLIKYLLQLEYYDGHAQRTLSYDREYFSNSLSIAPAQTVTRRVIKMP